MQYLYLINCQQYYKVGIANDVESRLSQLQTGNPFTLKIISCYSFHNAEIVERSIHQAWASERVRGEWFELGDAAIARFTQICNLLGGTLHTVGDSYEEYDEIEDVISDGEDQGGVRIEKRYDNGVLRGFVLRSRDKSRQVVEYVGSRTSPERFKELEKLLENGEL